MKAPQDAPGIATVQVTSWQAGYGHIFSAEFLSTLSIERRTTRWQDILHRRESQTLVARTGAGVAGFVSYGPWRDAADDPRQGEIWSLYVAPESWRSGVGRALLQAAVAGLRAQGRTAVLLWVLGENERGIRFYGCCGFQPVPGSSRQIELGGRSVAEICLQLAPDA